ncbi:HTTM domain-containing protein [Pontibacter sp. SGAir0037]|uniref:HTTM domain-containing protein n=1 Tax=Pontibacter sp. SGAir0037 TaxID=2571030 RepID=UPI0010CD4F8B|nr:HTTM domain-containing protein [Pontibacter sp. SGAir0037]QCR23230.1 hypothetical protein C1N53_13355 [Pontibacter sp. SGAir0037]
MKELFKPVSIYPLVYFRIAFGLLMFFEGVGAVAIGWVQEHYLEPSWHFNYIGLDWIKPLPGNGMIYLYLVMALLGLMMMIGWYYHISTFLFFLLFGFSFFAEKTHYLNHHYLIFLMSGIMALLPANRKLSMDVRRKPELEQEAVPQWTLWILLIQQVIVYFYAGIAKIQPDWLMGRPMRIWLSYKTEYPVIGPLLGAEPTVYIICWGGLFFDLFIAWMLLWPRTRVIGFWAAFGFHIFNSAVFHVGVFPYFMIAAAVLFFKPEQIARWFFRKQVSPELLAAQPIPYSLPKRKLVTAFFSVYILFHLTFPLRHFFIPGDVNWTEEGHRYSWRMMLRTKRGEAFFTVRDSKTGEEQQVFPRQYLTRHQASEMADNPDMLWQFAQFLKKEYAKKGVQQPQVYVQSYLSLNGYERHPLVDPTVDLAAIPYTMGAKSWVTPRPASDGWAAVFK